MGGGTTEGTGLVGGGGGEVGGTQHCMRGRGLWKACPGRNPEQAWVGAWKRACSMCPDLAFDSAQNFLEVRRRKTLKSLLLPSARRTYHVQSSAWRMRVGGGGRCSRSISSGHGQSPGLHLAKKCLPAAPQLLTNQTTAALGGRPASLPLGAPCPSLSHPTEREREGGKKGKRREALTTEEGKGSRAEEGGERPLRSAERTDLGQI